MLRIHFCFLVFMFSNHLAELHYPQKLCTSAIVGISYDTSSFPKIGFPPSSVNQSQLLVLVSAWICLYRRFHPLYISLAYGSPLQKDLNRRKRKAPIHRCDNERPKTIPFSHAGAIHCIVWSRDGLEGGIEWLSAFGPNTCFNQLLARSGPNTASKRRREKKDRRDKKRGSQILYEALRALSPVYCVLLDIHTELDIIKGRSEVFEWRKTEN